MYSNRESAAVGPDNQPLYRPKGLDSDSAGNVVRYQGIPVEDLETSGFPKSGSWEEQMAKIKEIRKAIYRTQKSFEAGKVEQERIKSGQDRYNKTQARIRKSEEGRERLKN